MATHSITVKVQLNGAGGVDWSFVDDSPELERKDRIDQVIWKLEAKDQHGNPMGTDELCFAPKQQPGKQGIELKGVRKSWPGNAWLSDAEERDLDQRVKGQKPRRDPPSDRRPSRFKWDVNPHVIMGSTGEQDGEFVHCNHWVRVVDAAGDVLGEIDPRVRFRSRF